MCMYKQNHKLKRNVLHYVKHKDQLLLITQISKKWINLRWNSSVDYINWEYKFDIRESDGNTSTSPNNCKWLLASYETQLNFAATQMKSVA